ncbi:hypothetical protein H4R21_001031 [Coemansia helicoidea]|uniref:Uncharacterized protein n=1 Tax=Coemansia helicoidea TaxID=1286919 RepID=A0ACC1LDJ9_9FUNG|nr:hypothetical protein H4R21_001031 [Coemansia helicoidea]
MFYRILFALLMLHSLVLSAPAPVDQPIAQPPTGDTMSAAFSAVATFAATAYSFAISWVLPAQPTPVAPAPTGYIASLKMIASQALTFIGCHAACLFPPAPARCPACWAAPAQPSPPSFAASLASIASQPFLFAHHLAARIHATASSVSMWGALFVVACCFVISWFCTTRTQAHVNRQLAATDANINAILTRLDTWDKRLANIQTPHRPVIEIVKLTPGKGKGKGKEKCDDKPQTLEHVHSTSAEHDAKSNVILDAVDTGDKRPEDMHALHAKVTELSKVVSGSIELFRETTTSLRESVAGFSNEIHAIRDQLGEPSAPDTPTSAFQPVSPLSHPSL